MINNKNTYMLLGPLLFTLTFLFEAPADMPIEAWHTAGLALWLGVWWVSECVPIPVTSLLPILIVPIAQINTVKAVTSLYAHPLIFLFLGGFLISIAMERWNLHKRIALLAMLKSGNNPRYQILAMMFISGFLSMWINNTATTLMMLPIALSVIFVLHENKAVCSDYDKALLLAIAYSASIGGIGTIIGTAPNALMAAYLQESYDINIGFAQWMLLTTPFCIVMIFLSWVWLTQCAFKIKDPQTSFDLNALFKQQLTELGQFSRAEKGVLSVFLFAALSWVLRPVFVANTGINITDTGIAIAAAILLFILPASNHSDERLLDWQSAQKVPWGILLLFGGGLALAAQIKGSGLALFIANLLSNASAIPLVLSILAVTALICFLTEMTSNTATAAGFLPLLGPVAEQVAGTPLVWVIPATIAASCAFMMPVATPPNAIVFGSNKINIKDMIKAGFALNIIAIVLITLLMLSFSKLVLGY